MNTSDRNSDPFYVKDTKVFGLEVIRWALMKPELRPRTVGELRRKFPMACFALNIPDGSENQTLRFAQGDESEHVINLPPRYKLLPMLKRLGVRWEDLVPEEERDPNLPASSEGGSYGYKDGRYAMPEFYDYLRTLSDADLFFNRVGDYSYAGCR